MARTSTSSNPATRSAPQAAKKQLEMVNTIRDPNNKLVTLREFNSPDTHHYVERLVDSWADLFEAAGTYFMEQSTVIDAMTGQEKDRDNHDPLGVFMAKNICNLAHTNLVNDYVNGEYSRPSIANEIGQYTREVAEQRAKYTKDGVCDEKTLNSDPDYIIACCFLQRAVARRNLCQGLVDQFKSYIQDRTGQAYVPQAITARVNKQPTAIKSAMRNEIIKAQLEKNGFLAR